MLPLILTKDISKQFALFIVCIILIAAPSYIHAISSDSQSDPYPFFTSIDPHTFLYSQKKLELLDLPYEKIAERISISLSPYGQNADSARDFCHDTVFLGDIEGKWSMIGLLLGCLPQGKTLPPTLVEARMKLFPNIDPATPILATCIDPAKNFGYFDVPLQYRKRGLRFEIQGRIGKDVGLRVQSGVADICQIITPGCSLVDTTTVGTTVPPKCIATLFPDVTSDNVQEYLMCKVCPIMQQLGYDINGFHEVAMEDLRMGMYWRHAFPINKGKKNWEEFLVIPFVMLEGSVPLSSKPKQPWKMFGVSFGSYDCNAVGMSAGLNVDFRETIEIGMDAEIAHFFDRNISCFYLPTSCCQSAIYPFSTNVNYKPGNNWTFTAKMSAYHFLGNLSFYFQYMIVSHQNDCIKLLNPDPAYKPELLEEKSSWQSQLGNVGFTYDISPNISIGFYWQAPLSQCHAYKSSTVMGCFNAVY